MSLAKELLLVVAVVGTMMWSSQVTESKFAGTHSFYVGSAPCIKCHNSNITSHTGTTAHDSFTCNTCHRAEPNITYQSKNVPGHEAHAASKGSCANCHTIIVVPAPTTTLVVTQSPTETLTVIPMSTETLTVTPGMTETLTITSGLTETLTV